MKNLVYKELSLSINKFLFILPLLLAALMLIPNWIFSIVLMYFFWISVSQIYGAYLAQNDYSFTAMLPVTKKDIAVSKSITLFIMEGIHYFLAVIFAIIHNQIYGTFNFFMELNVGFFGLMLLMLGIFNVIFLPLYFKTAYFFGKPVVIGVIVTLIYAVLLETGNMLLPEVRNILASPDMVIQGVLFISTGLVGILLSYLAVRLSVKNYENIK